MFAGLGKGKHLLQPASELYVLLSESYKQLLKMYIFFAHLFFIVVKSTNMKFHESVVVLMKYLIV